MERFYVGLIIYVSIIMGFAVALFAGVFADPIIHIELKETLTMTDKVALI